MKRSNLLALTLGICLAASVSFAANPVHWTFTNLVSHNGNGLCGTWSSAGQDPLDNGFDVYDYLLNFTKIELEYEIIVGGLVVATDWYDATSLVPSTSSSGQLDGPLPISNETIINESQSGVNVYARIDMSVGEDGIMNLNVYDQNINGAIGAMILTGDLRVSGTTDMTGSMVPEPCTIGILSIAGIALLKRRCKK